MTDEQTQASAEQQPPGIDFLKGVAADAMKAVQAKNAEQSQAGEPEALSGDALLKPAASEKPTPSAEPRPSNAESRIQELLAKNKELEARNSDLDTKFKTVTGSLVDFRKKEEAATMRQAILETLGQEGPGEAESDDGDVTDGYNPGAIADKVMALMQGSKSKSAQGRDPEVSALLEERKVLAELSSVVPEAALTPAQLGAVVELRQAAPDLAADEALLLAQHRRPSLFPETDNRGPDPRVHGTTKPTGRQSSTRTPKSDRQKEFEHVVAALETSGEERTARLLAGMSHNPSVQRAFRHINKS